MEILVNQKKELQWRLQVDPEPLTRFLGFGFRFAGLPAPSSAGEKRALGFRVWDNY